MRQIKFRGARMSDGETIYGYYHVRNGAEYIDEWRVDPDTVAQFVGEDANGDELYEGDEMTLTFFSGDKAKGTATIKAGAISDLLAVAYGLDCTDEFFKFEDLAEYNPRRVDDNSHTAAQPTDCGEVTGLTD